MKGAELWVRGVQQVKEFGSGIILLVLEKAAISEGLKEWGSKAAKATCLQKWKETVQLKLTSCHCEARGGEANAETKPTSLLLDTEAPALTQYQDSLW